MSNSQTPAVHVSFRYTEQEYLAAIRLFFWKSKESLWRLIIWYAFIAAGLFILNFALQLSFPTWIIVVGSVLVGVAWFHGSLIDLPRRYFRGDPKFRDEYNLTYTDAGIEFKTLNASGSFAWSFYTGVLENKDFYLLMYGKNLYAFSIVPKRAFRDAQQEAAFRELLRRHLDHNLKLGAGETGEYIPTNLEPPDWR